MSGVSIYSEPGLAPHPAEAAELAARQLDRMIGVDQAATRCSSPSSLSIPILHLTSPPPPSLGERLSGGVGGSSVSGLQDRDYPSGGGPEAAALRQRTKAQRVPLPAELVEHFGHMQCNCSMGVFPEVTRL